MKIWNNNPNFQGKMPLIDRPKDKKAILNLLEVFPVTAILGPRQVGKTTLAKTFKPDHIFDLENPRDMVLLENPQLALESLNGLIMIDEIQRKAELFPLLRYLVDQNPDQKYLILGSASSSLRQQSGESLAGRIGYHYLTGLNLTEVEIENIDKLWLRGGFPRSFLTNTEEQSLTWRNNFIATFLERDLRLLGINIPASTMFRFWIMLSHYHGQTINYSELARSFGISSKTVKVYLSILEDTFMLRQLMPWHVNVGKRLVKSPKIYLRDSGIFHALQSIENHQTLRTHPKLGASWEGFALEEIVSLVGKRDSEVFFYGTHGGVELDLYWQEGKNKIGVEFKFMDAPRTTKSMHQAVSDLALSKLFVVYPGDRIYPLTEKIIVTPLKDIGSLL
ncbi:MAG: ATP-binding protein [Bacteroidota bacterium]